MIWDFDADACRDVLDTWELLDALWAGSSSFEPQRPVGETVVAWVVFQGCHFGQASSPVEPWAWVAKCTYCFLNSYGNSPSYVSRKMGR